jgi:murein DD-endopeptidase MepM/ murein hydrolase activator NlpD
MARTRQLLDIALDAENGEHSAVHLLDPQRNLQRTSNAMPADEPWPALGFPASKVRLWEGALASHLPWFSAFSFAPGMLFGASHFWWPASRPRPSPHEGIDFGSYVDPDGECHALPVGTPVPCLDAGVVIAVFRDFIHSTVIVRHAGLEKEGRTLHSLFGHIVPSVQVGEHVNLDDCIGQISANSKTKAPPHLHLSAVWMEREDVPTDWGDLLSGAHIFGCPCKIAPAQIRFASDSWETESAGGNVQSELLNEHGAYALWL